MKKLLCVLLVLVMAMSFVACAPADSDEVTITFWTTPVLPDEATMQGFVDAFEKANPNINVELEYQTWEGIAEKLQIALSTDATPDVYLDGAARTAGLPALGVLAPVDDVFNSFNDWNDSVKNFGVIDGTHYLIPATQIGACSLTVNVTLAKELGVYDMLPEDRMTWTLQDFYDFVEACTKAGADKGIKGTCLYAGSQTSDDITYSLMLSNGGLIIDKENNVCVANSAACVEAIEILGNIVKNGYCLDGAALLDDSGTLTPFYNGQYVVALNMQSPNALVELENMKKEGYIDEVPDIRAYGIPTAEGKTMSSACWGANGLAIFDNKDEAKVNASKEFVKFLMGNKDFIEAVWNAVPNYSPSRNCGAKFTAENPAVAEETEFRQQLTAKYANFEFGIIDSYWSEVRSYFYPELQAVYSGTKTAQDAMDSFAANVDKVLGKK